MLTLFIGSALPKILVFLLLPLYTRTLPPSEYGYFDLSVTYGTIICSFLYMDIWVATLRFMYRDQDGSAPQTSIKSGWLIFGCASSAACLIALSVTFFFEVRYIWLLVAYCVSTNLRDFYGYVARGQGAHRAFSMSGAMGTTLTVALNMILLLLFHQDISALYIATVAGNLLQIVWLEHSTSALRNIWRQPLNWGLTRAVFVFTLPLGLNSLLYWLFTGFGKIVVQNKLSLAANGLFAVGSRFGALVIVLASILTMAWQDISFERKSNDNGEFYSRAISHFSILMAAGLAGLLVGICIFFTEIVGADYAASYPLIPSFVEVAVLGAFNTLIGNIFYAMNRPRWALYTTAIGAFFSIGLTIPLVEKMGIWGANIAVIVGFLSSIALRLAALKRTTSFCCPYAHLFGSAALIIIADFTYQIRSTPAAIFLLLALFLSFLFFYRKRFQAILTPSTASSNR